MFQRIRSWCHTQLTGHRQLPDLKQQMCRQGNNKVNPRGPSSIRSTASYFRLVIQQRDPQPCDQDIHPGPRPERVLERAGGFVRRPTPGKRRQRSPVAMRRTPQGRHSGQSKVRNNVRPGDFLSQHRRRMRQQFQAIRSAPGVRLFAGREAFRAWPHMGL